MQRAAIWARCKTVKDLPEPLKCGMIEDEFVTAIRHREFIAWREEEMVRLYAAKAKFEAAKTAAKEKDECNGWEL